MGFIFNIVVPSVYEIPGAEGRWIKLFDLAKMVKREGSSLIVDYRYLAEEGILKMVSSRPIKVVDAQWCDRASILPGVSMEIHPDRDEEDSLQFYIVGGKVTGFIIAPVIDETFIPESWALAVMQEIREEEASYV